MTVNEHGQPVGEPVTWGGATYPPGVVLVGEHVRLERLTRAHADDLFAATCGPGSEPDWTYMIDGPFADPAVFADFVEGMGGRDGLVTYAVVVDGRAQGMASYLRIAPELGSIEVGHLMFGAGLRGTPAAREAFDLLARHVFDDLGYRRYEWKCDALNERSRRAALRLGFGYEGTWRNALVYKGRNRDTAWFAMTVEDWNRRPR